MSENDDMTNAYKAARDEALAKEVISYTGIGEGDDDFTYDTIQEVIDASPLKEKVTFLWEDGMYLDSKYKYDNSDKLFEIFSYDELTFDTTGEPEEWVTLVKQMLIVVDDDSMDINETSIFGIDE
jgi:hypothetical protein